MARQKPNLLLKYYAEVTKSKHLHFGLWEPGQELNLKNLRAAQEKYLDHLMGYIPGEVKTILDAGCGVGGNALRLEKEGFRVTSASPDPYQEKAFRENTGGRIPFILSMFEDIETRKKFDLVLMSESAQYIDMKKGFDKCREVIKSGGYLLVSDFFKRDGVDDKGLQISGHPHARYMEEAKAAGFALLKSEDITDRISPTLDYMTGLFGDYLLPSFKTLAYAVEIYIPFFYGIARLLLGKPLKKTIAESVVDGKTFTAHRKYVIYLFQLNK